MPLDLHLHPAVAELARLTLEEAENLGLCGWMRARRGYM
jgi:hypothetical protein